MPTRIRMRDKEGRTITVTDSRVPKRGMVNIRNAFGFPERVPVKDLTAIPEDEPGSTLKFGDDA